MIYSEENKKTLTININRSTIHHLFGMVQVYSIADGADVTNLQSSQIALFCKNALLAYLKECNHLFDTSEKFDLPTRMKIEELTQYVSEVTSCPETLYAFHSILDKILFDQLELCNQIMSKQNLQLQNTTNKEEWIERRVDRDSTSTTRNFFILMLDMHCLPM